MPKFFSAEPGSTEQGKKLVRQKVSRNEFFGATVIPTVAGGFTDSHFFRDLGITSYGYSPFAFAPREFSGVHGNDERLAVEQLRRGVKIYYTVLQQFTARR